MSLFAPFDPRSRDFERKTLPSSVNKRSGMQRAEIEQDNETVRALLLPHLSEPRVRGEGLNPAPPAPELTLSRSSVLSARSPPLQASNEGAPGDVKRPGGLGERRESTTEGPSSGVPVRCGGTSPRRTSSCRTRRARCVRRAAAPRDVDRAPRAARVRVVRQGVHCFDSSAPPPEAILVIFIS